MRFVLVPMLALMLAATPVLAGEIASSGPGTTGPLAVPAMEPLPPGKPAGVAQANNHQMFIYISLGMIAIAAGGLALDFANRGGSSSTATTN